MKKNARIFSSSWSDYELIDAGKERKLERWGFVITIRPERQAYFDPNLSDKEWRDMADWEFLESKNQSGTWKSLSSKSDQKWQIGFEEIKFNLELTHFKHVGLFPEQESNWRFIREELKSGQRFLNLFAYTGASSLMARSTGAEVVHCDSVRQLVDWSNLNQQSSELEGIKWVVDDALTFAKREVKRGNFYDMIQMDPPAFGLGKKGQKWKIENKIQELLSTAKELLNPGGWLILNTYSPRLEIDKLEGVVRESFGKSPELISQLWMKTKFGNRMYTGDLVRIQK